MEVDINWAAVLLGAFAAMITGMVWYHPKVFGVKWMKSIGLTQKQMDSGQMQGMILAVVRSLITSFALYHIIYVTDAFYSSDSFLTNAIGVGLWVSMAIVGITMVMHDNFEQRPKLATRINVGFEVATVFIMALVIGVVAG